MTIGVDGVDQSHPQLAVLSMILLALTLAHGALVILGYCCPLNDLLLMMYAAGSLSPVLNIILKATRLYWAQAGALLVPDTRLRRPGAPSWEAEAQVVIASV
jgi:hypothetical protein